jgi:hypothetical protein
MFRRLLGSGHSDAGSRRVAGRSGGSEPGTFGRKKKNKTSGNDENTLGMIRKGMEEEHFASGVTKDKVAMADKLDSHKAGTNFKYAVIGSAPSDERTGIMSRLRTYKAPSKVSNHTLSEIPAIRLLGDAVQFPMTDALKTPGGGGNGDYCLIDSVMIHFVPLDSFLNDKSVITIQLNDFRKISATAVRTARVDNTMAYNLLFSLDFCVETRDLDKMTLSFACPQKDFQEGVAWGAVKVVAQVAFLSFPKRLPVIETLAVAIFADTDLLEYDWDPREIDAVLTPQALKGLREANRRGEVENLTLPRDDKVDNTMARTVMGKTLEDSSAEEVISAMKKAALRAQRPLTNLRDLGESSGSQVVPRAPLKSALKKVNEVNHQKDDSSERSFEELSPNDSQSMQGSNDDLSDVGMSPARGKRIARFTG